HTGAKTCLVTTSGNKDVLFIGRVAQKVAGLSERELIHQTALKKADPPLIDPLHSWEVSERIDFQGKVVVSLNVKEVEKVVENIKDNDIEAVAISCLWSFLNNSHEEEIKKIIEEKIPGIYLCISSEVAPLIGEYERTVTTVLSAYIAPKLIEYLKKLQDKLQQRGYKKQMLIAHSMGGLSSLDEVTHRPLLTLDSGPAGGVLGTRNFGSIYNEPNIIAVDMGGTSFDVSLIHNSEISLDERPVIGQYTFLTPKIATYSIGAGGGSIVWIDPYGIPQVGPQSAGASPGAVCYDMGGKEPTVTDVDLALGYLSPDYFLEGRQKLNKAKAEAALDRLARKLGLDVIQTAMGAFKIVNSHMADLVRKV
ncbi:MAG: hydantoinase/oxoprolinase family protein, partial [Dehalococcoidia bacterium]|nr:hydantoinase/oxoprolinase family protein [Dehalococcoidia bacterium]